MRFINYIIEHQYGDVDEDAKRSISILLILDFLLISLMTCWCIIFWILPMVEMFWLTFVLLIGFIIAFVGLSYKLMSFESGRVLSMTCGGLITGVPPLFYGLDTIVTVHLAFLALAIILMFSRQERKIFLTYFKSIILLFLFVIIWNFTVGPVVVVEPRTFKIFNIIVALDTMFISLYFTYFFFFENAEFKDLLATEREKSDNLLLSIFPSSVASKLRDSNRSLADSFDNVTIIFADIVGFTQLSSQMSPDQLVRMLDEVFSEFDALVDKYKIEKIKTIGDAYMAVGGLPIPDDRHCHNVADLALEIMDIIKIKFGDKYDLDLRIGIHSGKAVAGVIGNKKFSYDLWGDSVNIASRYEASGQPGKIHVSQEVRQILGTDYSFEEGGEVMIKGKGMMKSSFLLNKNGSNHKDHVVDIPILSMPA